MGVLKDVSVNDNFACINGRGFCGENIKGSTKGEKGLSSFESFKQQVCMSTLS
jgi:hypothetical protein